VVNRVDLSWPGLERDLGGAAIAAGEIVPDPAIPRYMECCGGRSGVLARDENLLLDVRVKLIES